MNSINTYILGFCLFTGIVLVTSFSNNVDQYHQIGNVVFSVLPPNDFNQENEGTWVLMDGTPLDSINQLTFKYGIDTLPNAQGRFPRIIDMQKGDSRVDRDRVFSNQRVGSLQEDATRKPNNELLFEVTNNTHNHGHKVSYIEGMQSAIYGATSNRSRRIKVLKEVTEYDGIGHGIGHNTIASHSIKISQGWDSESRPKNIILYAYMKIN